jgi:hypothetical protein
MDRMAAREAFVVVVDMGSFPPRRACAADFAAQGGCEKCGAAPVVGALIQVPYHG